jgi:hypothetical protein
MSLKTPSRAEISNNYDILDMRYAFERKQKTMKRIRGRKRAEFLKKKRIFSKGQEVEGSRNDGESSWRATTT